MKDALKSLLDAATAGVDIGEYRGPAWPSRNGLVHVTASGVADAVSLLASAAADDAELRALAQHVAAEIVEISQVRRRAADQQAREANPSDQSDQSDRSDRRKKQKT